MLNLKNPYSVPKASVYAIRLMSVLSIIACLFVVVQSCSLEQKPSLSRFAKGGLKKLEVLQIPPPQPQMTFMTADGGEASLKDFLGKIVLLNIWATWCAPCIAEIPSLDELQAQRSGENFTVITISMDRHIEDARTFFEANNISNLALYHDPSYSISAKVGVHGIPVSIFYDPSGQEITRIAGEVDWKSDAVATLLDAIFIKY